MTGVHDLLRAVSHDGLVECLDSPATARTRSGRVSAVLQTIRAPQLWPTGTAVPSGTWRGFSFAPGADETA